LVLRRVLRRSRCAAGDLRGGRRRRFGASRRWSGAEALELLAELFLEERLELGALDHLLLEKHFRHLLEAVPVILEDLHRLRVRLIEELARLLVDPLGRALAVVPFLLREVAAEEDLLLLAPEGDGAERLAHAVAADHRARETRGAIEVVRGAGRL